MWKFQEHLFYRARPDNCFCVSASLQLFENLGFTVFQNVLSSLTLLTSGSSLPEVFCRKGVLRNFAKFTGKRLWQSLFFNKVTGECNSIKRETLSQVFSWEFCEIYKNAFFYRIPLLTASGLCFERKNFTREVSVLFLFLRIFLGFVIINLLLWMSVKLICYIKINIFFYKFMTSLVGGIFDEPTVL